jgi:hypothetical protein
MFGSLARFAKRIWDRLASAAQQPVWRVTQPALANFLIGSMADLPRSHAQLLADACVPTSVSNWPFCTARPRLPTSPSAIAFLSLLMLMLAPWVPNWQSILQIVQPETLLRWHPHFACWASVAKAFGCFGSGSRATALHAASMTRPLT